MHPIGEFSLINSRLFAFICDLHVISTFLINKHDDILLTPLIFVLRARIPDFIPDCPVHVGIAYGDTEVS